MGCMSKDTCDDVYACKFSVYIFDARTFIPMIFFDQQSSTHVMDWTEGNLRERKILILSELRHQSDPLDA